MHVKNVMKHWIQNAISKSISAEHKRTCYACDGCGETFGTKCTLKEHLSAEHMKTAQKQPEAFEPDVPKIEQAQQKVAVISPVIVEIEPIDSDEDFSDIYLGVKDEFVEGK